MESVNARIINGCKVIFPPGKKPFPAQLAIMSKVLCALNKQEHALIESPTGTGKTLALLSSSLAWQRKWVEDEMLRVEALEEQHQEQERRRTEQARQRQQFELRKKQLKERKERATARSRPRQKQARRKPDVVTLIYDNDTGECSDSDDDDFVDSGCQRARASKSKSSSSSITATADSTGLEFDDCVSQEHIDPVDSGGFEFEDCASQNSPSVASDLPNTGAAAAATANANANANAGTEAGTAPSCVSNLDCVNNMCGSACANAASETAGAAPRPRNIKLRRPPTVFFASRTHSQLAQVIGELKRCPKEVHRDLSMVVLASRSHYCIHRTVSRKGGRKGRGRGGRADSKRSTSDGQASVALSVDEACKQLLETGGCSHAHRAAQLKSQAPRIWDVEDLIQTAKSSGRGKGCPYFASRMLAQDATLVFCPYNYLMDPVIRRSLDVNVKGAVVIVDEAHNIEEVARSAASLELSLAQLRDAAQQLSDPAASSDLDTGASSHKRVHEVVKALADWLEESSKEAELKAEASDVGYAGNGTLCANYRCRAPLQRKHTRCPRCNTPRAGGAPKSAQPEASTGREQFGWGRGAKVYAGRGGESHSVCSASRGLAQLQQFAQFPMDTEQFESLHDAWVRVRTSANEARNAQSLRATGPQQHRGKRGRGAQGGSGDDDAGGASMLGITSHQLTAGALQCLDRLFTVLRYVYSDGLRHLNAFRFVLHRVNSWSSSRHQKEWLHKLCIWCLSPAVAFADLSKEAHSIVLTSGTLSPLNSFASELGVPFPIRLEAAHVIDARRQVLAMAVAYGPGGRNGVKLLGNYQSSQSFQYLDSLGEAVLQFISVAPGGALLFFPSYALMERVMQRWHESGAAARISAVKEIFVESSARQQKKQQSATSTASPPTFEEIIGAYRDAVRRYANSVPSYPHSSAEPAVPKLQNVAAAHDPRLLSTLVPDSPVSGQKTTTGTSAARRSVAPTGLLTYFLKMGSQTASATRTGDANVAQMEQHPTQNVAPSTTGTYQRTGAILLAVCRGKVSEGIDFSDAQARLVMCVSIPFPNAKDPYVVLKKAYQDKRTAEEHAAGVENMGGSVPSGNVWYSQQAYRALNQAVGRCIRHKNDFGSVIMLDSRFVSEGSASLGGGSHGYELPANHPISNLSKWIRGHVRRMPASSAGFNEATARLRDFFASQDPLPQASAPPATASVEGTASEGALSTERLTKNKVSSLASQQPHLASETRSRPDIDYPVKMSKNSVAADEVDAEFHFDYDLDAASDTDVFPMTATSAINTSAVPCDIASAGAFKIVEQSKDRVKRTLALSSDSNMREWFAAARRIGIHSVEPQYDQHMREQLIKCSEQPFDLSVLLEKMEQHCKSSRGDGQAAVLRFTILMLEWLASPRCTTVPAAQAANLAAAKVAGELAACRRRRNPINAMQSLDKNVLSLDSSSPSAAGGSTGAPKGGKMPSSTFKRKQQDVTVPSRDTWAEAEAAAGIGDFGIGGPTGSGSSSSATLVKRHNKLRKMSNNAPTRPSQRAKSVAQRVHVSAKAKVRMSTADSDADDFV